MARYVNYNGRRYDLPSDQSGITTKEMVTLERELRVSLLDPDLGDSLGVRLGWAWIVIRRTITGLTLDELYEAVDENRFEFKTDADEDEAVEEDEVPPTGASEEAGIPSSSSDGESGPATSTPGSPPASSTGSSPSSRPSGNKRSRRAA